MLIIIGTSLKEHKEGEGVYRCPRCGNTGNWSKVKSTQYLSLFFVPLIPVNSRRYWRCPICNHTVEASDN